MEALNFLKFCKPTMFSPCNGIPNLHTETDAEEEEEDETEDQEEGDSFFDLELITDPEIDPSQTKITNNDHPLNQNAREINAFFSEEKEECLPKPGSNKKPCFSSESFSVSPSDPISKRKILPIEPNSKPQSPITLLKSSPKFRSFIFKKQKSMSAEKTEKPEKTEETESVKQSKKQGKIFPFKFNRENSISRKTQTDSKIQNLDDPTEKSSKIFSKESMNKYLKLIKPLYRTSKRKTEMSDYFSGELSTALSPAISLASPMKEKQANLPGGIRMVCRNLGKCKSASTVSSAAVQPQNRRDDSLLQQHDGIQSAILHCKRSFNASRDASVLEGMKNATERQQLEGIR